MNSLDLGMIGNCQINALIDDKARIVWSCLPQFDSNPAFCSLLQNGDAEPERGFYDIELIDFVRSEQQYVVNTAILQTTLYDSHGNSVRVNDFAPRFLLFGRSYHPVMLTRIIKPLEGTPRIRVRLRPACDYGAEDPQITFGSNHVRYVMPEVTMRLTTNVPLTSIRDESVFALHETRHLVLGPDESIVEDVATVAHEAFRATQGYWEGWVRGLAIPYEWQEAVIRAAITLKLCTFEDTGAVIAAATTSIPEAANSGRNWDYRYCWLRDSYFVIQALNRLGATKTMSGYLRYIYDVSLNNGAHLQPVYAISGRADLTESEVTSLSGYRGMGPVRVGNQAFEQTQNDSYGAVVLSATQHFFDSRLIHGGDLQQFQQLERLGERAVELFDQPDAGLWEYRGRAQVHTYSAIVCWSAADRLEKVARLLGEDERAVHWQQEARRLHAVIYDKAWNEKRGAFTEGFDNDNLDASLLTIHSLGFVPADDPRFLATVRAVETELKRGEHLYRYGQADDFGVPENAFSVCTFWYIEALASTGRADEARELFEGMLACRNSLGLLSEDLDPKSHELWGNFPQTYSMVGIINSARILSIPWESAL
ncbi:MAG: glycoside hydrolase family 15 protein [Gammaproteobacteria bacterium]